VLALVLGSFFGHKVTTGLPIYTSEQSASSHAGYRHSTLTCGTEVYVSDYEEACLQLAYPDPQTAIGRMGMIGDAKVCAIPGQPATAYIAGDVGSEMPAYAPYRHISQPPFDWRNATFREMNFMPGSSGNVLQTTDPALIAEVVRFLRDGTSVELPTFSFMAIANLASLRLTCDQLPNLLFCPSVYTDANGQIYLAESLMLTTTTPPQLTARWIPASPMLMKWLKGL
jgi:hypothetical protein